MAGIIDFFRLLYHRRFWTKQQIVQYQISQLNHLLRHSRDHAAYYRDTIPKSSVKSLTDFQTLPIINKRIMMEHFDQINTVGLKREEVMDYAIQKELSQDYLGYYKDEYVIGLSSGTSGNKGLYITPKDLTKKLPFVFLARSGIPLRILPYRILFMLRVFSQGFDDINSFLISLKYLSTMTPVDQIITAIQSNNINILMAPPSLMRLLLPVADQIKAQLKMIVTYAEVLESEEKQRLVKTFGCRVIEIYQGSEGQFASACNHGNLHINEDLVFVELLDEQYQVVNTPHMVARHMIITNLVNHAQPLIRYEMNDLIVLDEPCPCKSNFRRIKNILGRNDDILYFKTKKNTIQHIFPDLFSRWIITTSESIREYQVHQGDDHDLTITIDPIDPCDHDRLVADLKTRLHRELDVYDIEAVIEIHLTSITLPSDRSKYKRFTVSKSTI